MRVANIDISRYGDLRLPSLTPAVMVAQVEPDLVARIEDEVRVAESRSSGVFDPRTENSLGHKTDTYFRSSSYCEISVELRKEVDATISFVVSHSVVPNIGAQATRLCERQQFLRYSSTNSGHFLAHTDSAYIDGQGVFRHTSPERMLTSILFVNEGFEGGDLILHSVFDDNDQPLVFKAKAGTLVIFPSDLRFVHEVRPVTRGERYTVVGWHSITW
jgi:predicted 2-oxoglutarate/Fe(II)-dependent dioxygenase YbiX